MDQQNNRAVPGEPAPDGQPQQAGPRPDGQAVPAAAWEVFPGHDAGQQAPGWGEPRITESGPSRGWAAPEPDQPAGWGSTTADAHRPQDQSPQSASTGWGAPYPAAGQGRAGDNRGKATRKGLIIGGVAVAVAAAAGAGAYAAGSSSATAAGNTQGGAGGSNGQFGQGGQFAPGGQSGMNAPDGTTGGTDGRGMGGPGGLGMGMAGLNAAIHAEYVILQDSSYVTMASQTGTVTNVSSDSLTVKSEDGFTRTYAVSADVQVSEGARQRGSGSTGSSALGLSAVTSGATVRVTAIKNSDTYTAQTILLSASGTATSQQPGTTTN